MLRAESNFSQHLAEYRQRKNRWDGSSPCWRQIGQTEGKRQLAGNFCCNTEDIFKRPNNKTQTRTLTLLGLLVSIKPCATHYPKVKMGKDELREILTKIFHYSLGTKFFCQVPQKFSLWNLLINFWNSAISSSFNNRRKLIAQEFNSKSQCLAMDPFGKDIISWSSEITGR